MISITIYYFYRYITGLDYTVQFYKDNWYARVSDEEEYDAIKAPKSFLLSVANYDNAILDVYLTSNNSIKELDKCNYNFEIDEKGEYYCFNLSFYHMDKDKINSILFECLDNCTDSKGRPAEIYIQMYTRNLV